MNNRLRHTSPHKQPSFVFKRWSRKGYAIFAGLHRHIVIGTLSISICYAAMLKIDSLITLADGQTSRLQQEDGDFSDSSGPPGAALPSTLCLFAADDSDTLRDGTPLHPPSRSLTRPPEPHQQQRHWQPGFSFFLIRTTAKQLQNNYERFADTRHSLNTHVTSAHNKHNATPYESTPITDQPYADEQLNDKYRTIIEQS